VRVCCHIATFNTNALKYAGASGDSLKELAGGPVGQRNGVNNGVMFENACMEVLSTAQPSLEEMVDALGVISGMFLKEGITCCHDAGGHGASSMKAFQRAVELDRIKTRVITMLFALVGESTAFSNLYINSGIYTGFGNDRLKLGPIKIMIDGSSSGPTAATVEEYASAPGNHGLLSLTQEYIDDIVLRAHTAGYQMTTHAVGDKAVIMFLDAVEKALRAHPRQDHRHRIEHCAMVGHNPDIIKRIKKLGIIPAAQPIFLYEFGDGYLRNFGEKRGGGMFPSASLLKAGIPVAGSSDCPVTFSNPLLNIHVAVNRETQTGQLIGPDERISVADALRMFTYNAAYVSFDEKKRGSLEAGKFADLAVLSEPLMSISPKEIKDVVVDMTFIDGQKLYDRQA
jgi:predicted amidohydrolase YtcJ